MTEREFVDKMIEGYKEGYNIGTMYVCHEIDCEECPLCGAEECEANEKKTPMLVNEIIRLREEKSKKVETNLEHYFKRKSDNSDESYAGYLTTTQLTMFCSDTSAMVRFRKSNAHTLIDWLLSPYEPPKRYQMSQFEYDLLKSYKENYYENWAIEQLVLLHYMKSLGYFKNVPTDIRIGYVLENAEVVE